MAEDPVTLECPSCGAGVDIYRDTATFRCHRCATTIAVGRQGDKLTLNGAPPSQPGGRTWPHAVSTDSSIANIEEVLARLRQAEQRLQSELKKRRRRSREASIGSFILLVAGSAILVIDKDSSTQVAMVLLVAANLLFGGWLFLHSEDTAEPHSARTEIARIEMLLAEKRGSESPLIPESR